MVADLMGFLSSAADTGFDGETDWAPGISEGALPLLAPMFHTLRTRLFAVAKNPRDGLAFAVTLSVRVLRCNSQPGNTYLVLGQSCLPYLRAHGRFVVWQHPNVSSWPLFPSAAS